MELFGKDQRHQTIVLMIAFFSFGIAVVPTNLCIVYWLTHFNGFSSHSAVLLMRGCAAIGIWFYIFAGLLGERVSRRKILFWTAVSVPITTFAFMWTHSLIVSSVIYFFVYQATNGTWSGAGFTYVAESFPTRLRGTATGFIDSMMVSGYVLGAAIWTGLIHYVSPELVWGIVAVLLACGEMGHLVRQGLRSAQGRPVTPRDVSTAAADRRGVAGSLRPGGRSRTLGHVVESHAGAAAMLHLTKLAVGVRDLDHLRALQAERAGRDPPLRHRTRNFPRRAEEVTDGGSIYWVIGGFMQARQRVLDIIEDHWSDGSTCAGLVLDPELAPLVGRPTKPFQGWRYLAPEAAPPDLLVASPARGEAQLPPVLRRELRALCLI